MSNVYPSNLQESQIANYAVSCDLHSLITVYKGFRDNKFVDFPNKTYPQCDDKGNIISNFTSVSSVKIDGEMQFAVFFDDGKLEADLYPFKSEKEKNEDKLEKKNREVQNTKGVKFSNKNFFRGK